MKDNEYKIYQTILTQLTPGKLYSKSELVQLLLKNSKITRNESDGLLKILVNAGIFQKTDVPIPGMRGHKDIYYRLIYTPDTALRLIKKRLKIT